jgi:preprotein translocase subunit SecE
VSDAMSRNIAVLLYVVTMVALIVGVDFLFLRDRFWWRLATNIGIVFVFAAFYLLYLRRH